MEHHTKPTNALGLRRSEVVNLYGSESLLKDCVRAQWLKPVVRRGRLTLFDREEVFAVWDRIKGGELPPQKNR